MFILIFPILEQMKIKEQFLGKYFNVFFSKYVSASNRIYLDRLKTQNTRGFNFVEIRNLFIG